MTAKERMVELTYYAMLKQRLTTRFIRESFGVSRATAKRDLATIQRRLKELRAA